MTTSPPTLTDMPDLVLSKIFEEVGFPGILKLQKVCRSLREFLQNFPPDPKRLSIHLTLYRSHEIKVKFEPEDQPIFEVCYFGNNRNCTIKTQNREKILDKSDSTKVLFQDLKIILDSQKSEIQNFKVKNRIRRSSYSVFLEKLDQFMANYTPKLKVQNFHMNFYEIDQVTSILRNFDSKKLEEISLFPSLGTPLNFQSLVKMDQWKNSKRVRIHDGTVVGDKVEDFLHFSEILVKFESVSTKDLVLMAEKFLNSPIPRDYRITYNCFEDKGELLNLSGPAHCFTDLVQYGKKLFKPVPNSSDAVFISQSIKARSFNFSRIPLEDVSKNY